MDSKFPMRPQSGYGRRVDRTGSAMRLAGWKWRFEYSFWCCHGAEEKVTGNEEGKVGG